MNWILVLKTVFALISALSKRADEQRARALREEGRKIERLEAFMEQVKDATNIVNDIEAVRRAFRDRVAALPDSLRDDDGHKRAD